VIDRTIRERVDLEAFALSAQKASPIPERVWRALPGESYSESMILWVTMSVGKSDAA
jgi:hypothetical protein